MANKKRTLEPITMVNVINNTLGTLVYKSEFTGKGFVIEGYGKPKKIQYQDLENLHSEHPTIIDQAWLFIDDQDAVENMYLTDLYETLVSPKEIDEFIAKTEEEIVAKISNSPKGMKTILAQILMQKYHNGEKELQNPLKRLCFERLLGIKFEN